MASIQQAVFDRIATREHGHPNVAAGGSFPKSALNLSRFSAISRGYHSGRRAGYWRYHLARHASSGNVARPSQQGGFAQWVGLSLNDSHSRAVVK